MSSKRVSGTRQHRRLRSQLAAADRRLSEQADGTAWMALFCQNMLEIAVELTLEKPAYFEMVASSSSISCGSHRR